jgi:hypothetical protein
MEVRNSNVPRANPIDDLARKLLTALQQQQSGGDYPTTVERLAALADPQATPEQVKKALNKKPFAALWLIANKKDTHSPIVLVEDLERLAASEQLLEYALGQLCSAEKPSHPPAKLIAKVEKPLRPAFQSALERAVAQNTVPPTVGIAWVKKKPHFYLQRFPPPPPPLPKKKPAEELSEQLVRVLTEQREGANYPLPLDRLFVLTATTAAATVRKQALGKEPFRSQALLALPKRADGPVALSADRDRLLSSPPLLHSVLDAARTPDNQAVAAADLVMKLPKTLQIDFRGHLQRRIASRGFPETIGLLYSKKKPLLFFRADLDAAPIPPPPAPTKGNEVEEKREESIAPPRVEFAHCFEEAFARLDRERGGHNHVSLVELRRAVPVERSEFDAGLQHLRRAGRYSLSAAEGRHGIRDDERTAGILEDGSLLLFVSRRE